MYLQSVFNDVLGPVMTGPSSSHTAGPGRIGYMLSCLVKNVTKIQIVFPKESSYAGAYKGQKSDMAFIGGILGYKITDENFKNSLEIAKDKNISVNFSIKAVPCPHPNTAYIEIYDGKECVTATTYSTGGGTIEVVKICNTPILIKGDCYLIGLIEKDNKNNTDRLCRSELTNFQALHSEEGDLLLYKVFEEPKIELIEKLKKITNNNKVYYIEPVLPVIEKEEQISAYKTGKDFVKFLNDNNKDFWQGALNYEVCRSGWSEKEVIEYTNYLLEIIEKSIKDGIEIVSNEKTFWKQSAKNLLIAHKSGRALNLGVIDKSHIYATAIMELNSYKGTVVAAPTAGSCGVIGGMLMGFYDTGNYSKEEISKALLCAGMVGIFISYQATFAAESAGCQAEMGSASAMAAAAAAYLQKASNEEILNAANIAMQNMLGLICDPVGCCAAIPCINRNSSAISNAVVSANLALGGYDPVIPFDETIIAMNEVGKNLPREFRCTGLGGLCDTETGIKINDNLN